MKLMKRAIDAQKNEIDDIKEESKNIEKSLSIKKEEFTTKLNVKEEENNKLSENIKVIEANLTKIERERDLLLEEKEALKVKINDEMNQKNKLIEVVEEQNKEIAAFKEENDKLRMEILEINQNLPNYPSFG